jgi:hypothetical protein
LELVLTRLPVACTRAVASVARQRRDRAAVVTDVRGQRAIVFSLGVAAHSSVRWVRRPGGKGTATASNGSRLGRWHCNMRWQARGEKRKRLMSGPSVF